MYDRQEEAVKNAFEIFVRADCGELTARMVWEKEFDALQKAVWALKNEVAQDITIHEYVERYTQEATAYGVRLVDVFEDVAELYGEVAALKVFGRDE